MDFGVPATLLRFCCYFCIAQLLTLIGALQQSPPTELWAVWGEQPLAKGTRVKTLAWGWWPRYLLGRLVSGWCLQGYSNKESLPDHEFMWGYHVTKDFNYFTHKLNIWKTTHNHLASPKTWRCFYHIAFRLVADIPFDPGFPIVFVSLAWCLYYVSPESAEEVVQEKDVWATPTWLHRNTLKKGSVLRSFWTVQQYSEWQVIPSGSHRQVLFVM